MSNESTCCQTACRSWRSPRTAIGQSSIAGMGNFATARIERDEVVAVRSGHIVPLSQALELVPTLGFAFLQITETLALSALCAEELPSLCCYFNHSCQANVGMRGDILFVAMRTIEPGEELS